MTSLPIVGRELRVAARRPSTYYGRVGAAVLPIAAAFLFLPAFGGQSFAEQGRILFSVLSMFAWLYSLSAGLRVTSDCVSSEKREGTLGLLFLTNLKGYDVVLGKLVSSSLPALYGLFAVLPVLAQTLFLGGVTLAQVGLMALVLINTLFFSLCGGLFVSTMSRDARKALYSTIGLMLLVVLGPYAVALIAGLNRTTPIIFGAGHIFEVCDPRILSLSPFLAFQIADMPLGMMLLGPYFTASLITIHFLSWSLLLAASLIIRHLCRERPKAKVELRWREIWNKWSFGSGVDRRDFRASLLDRNAFYWLGARDRLKARCALFLFGAFVVLWFWGWWCLSRFVFDWDVSAGLLFFVYLLFKLWIASEVCMRFVEDRQCGALELILSSPLRVRSIALGQFLALMRQFGIPILGVVGASIFLRAAAISSPHSGVSEADVAALFSSGLIVFLADLATLPAVAIHQATYKPSLNRALTSTYFQVLLLPWLAFGATMLCLIIWLALVPGPGSSMGLAGSANLWLVISLIVDLLLGWNASFTFYKYFRGAAAKRYGGLESVRVSTQRSLRQRWTEFRSRSARSPSPHNILSFWKRAALITAVAVFLGAAFLAVQKYSRSRQLALKIAALQSAGNPVTLSELRDSLPTVPPSENAGMILVQAVGAVPPTHFWGTNSAYPQWSRHKTPLTPAMRQFLDEWAEANRTTRNLPRQAASLPKSRYPIDWSAASWRIPTQLEGLEGLLRGWPLEAQWFLMHDRRDDLFEFEQAWFGVARAIDQEPFISAQYLRASILNAAGRILERMLNDQPLPEERLREFSHLIEEAEERTLPTLRGALIGQRCLDIATFRTSDPRWLAQSAPPPTGLAATMLGILEFARHLLGRDDQELLYYLAAVDQHIHAADSLFATIPQCAAFPQIITARPRQEFAPWNRANQLLERWEGLLLWQLEILARLRVARVAIAVERFHLAHGSWPISLEALTPELLAEIPKDPFDGSVLHYRRLKEGYVVYSVGPDQHDNAGMEREKSRLEYDLTFTVER